MPRNSNKDIQSVFESFMLSREAMYVTKSTLNYYRYNLTKFFSWLNLKEVQNVDEVAADHVRKFLVMLQNQQSTTTPKNKLSDSYVHSYARCIRTFFRFCYEERLVTSQISFQMPKIAKKKLRVLSEKEIVQVLKHCNNLRDKCLFSLMVDTGLRLSEVSSLNWEDVDAMKGTINVLCGKGRKYRLVACGANVKYLLKKLHNEVNDEDTEGLPVFATDDGMKRLSSRGIRSVLIRLNDKSGVRFSAHALRRTFAHLAVRSGMGIVYIQRMMGHENLETTRNYVQELDDRDVIKAARTFSPIDKFTG